MDKLPIQFTRTQKITPLLQSEAAECGLACLGMVTNYFGANTDISTLRQQFSISMKGCSMADLLTMAEQLGMTGRGLRLELDELDQLQTPCILHWELAHFVILEKVSGNKVTIVDPARGRIVYTLEEVSPLFTGIALELLPSSEFKPPKEKTALKFSHFWSGLSGLKRFLIHLALLTLILQIFGLAGPYAMQIVTDQVIASHDLSLLNVVMIGFALLMFLEVSTGWLRSFVGQRLSHQLSFQMNANLLQHVLHLPLNYFEKRQLGDIMSRFGSLAPMQSMLTDGLVGTVLDGIMAVTTLTMLLIYSPILVVVTAVALCLYLGLRFALYPQFKRLADESLVAGAKQSSNLMETMRSMQAIKLYGRESQRHALWQNLTANSMNLSIRNERLGFWQENLNQIIFGSERLILLYLGAHIVIAGNMTLGMLMAFLAYKEQFSSRVLSLINIAMDYKMLRVHLDRLADMVFTEKETSLTHQQTPDIQGCIELRNISFRYADFEPELFENLNLTINAGESVALVGPSGVGKTTLMKIMLGLFKPTAGQVLIDGKALKDYSISGFRSQVATVMQDEQLLAGSVAENICFFDANPDQTWIEKCATLAGLHEEICAMTMGYHTLVGEMGSTLSGGQKQRLVLARALYKKPKILFMDEATSHLDVALEQAVNQAIQTLNITRVIIAHRPQTIACADRIIEIRTGQTHEAIDHLQ